MTLFSLLLELCPRTEMLPPKFHPLMVKDFSMESLCVFAPRRTKYEILEFIIEPVMVFMVYCFLFFKKSAKLLLNYETMFCDISLFPTHGVRRHLNIPVFTSADSSSFPVRGLFHLPCGWLVPNAPKPRTNRLPMFLCSFVHSRRHSLILSASPI